VRAFTPFVAGVARMSYARFVAYNIVGGIGWITSMTLCGYWLGRREWIRQNFEMVVIAIVLVSVPPIAAGMLRHWLQSRRPERREELSVGATADHARDA
jgi:membrane-associated protein